MHPPGSVYPQKPSYTLTFAPIRKFCWYADYKFLTKLAFLKSQFGALCAFIMVIHFFTDLFPEPAGTRCSKVLYLQSRIFVDSRLHKDFINHLLFYYMVTYLFLHLHFY